MLRRRRTRSCYSGETRLQCLEQERCCRVLGTVRTRAGGRVQPSASSDRTRSTLTVLLRLGVIKRISVVPTVIVYGPDPAVLDEAGVCMVRITQLVLSERSQTRPTDGARVQSHDRCRSVTATQHPRDLPPSPCCLSPRASYSDLALECKSLRAIEPHPGLRGVALQRVPVVQGTHRRHEGSGYPHRQTAS